MSAHFVLHICHRDILDAYEAPSAFQSRHVDIHSVYGRRSRRATLLKNFRHSASIEILNVYSLCFSDTD